MVFYKSKAQLKGLQSYGPSKLEFIKNSRPFGFEATFFARLYCESLLFEQPGFDSQWGQTLRAYSFATPWPTGLKITFIEDLIFIY